MPVVGYVTTAEALEYIKTRYVAANELRVAWETLTEEDQAAYLQRSFDAMELLVYRGRKYSVGQTTAFPRWPDPVVPEAVKRAQIENAVTLSDPTAVEEADLYDRLWRYGVESYKIGNLSESSSSGAWGRANGSAGVDLPSVEAAKLLRPYLGGGFNIE